MTFATVPETVASRQLSQAALAPVESPFHGLQTSTAALCRFRRQHLQEQAVGRRILRQSLTTARFSQPADGRQPPPNPRCNGARSTICHEYHRSANCCFLRTATWLPAGQEKTRSTSRSTRPSRTAYVGPRAAYRKVSPSASVRTVGPQYRRRAGPQHPACAFVSLAKKLTIGAQRTFPATTAAAARTANCASSKPAARGTRWRCRKCGAERAAAMRNRNPTAA